jgi:hypothetical protein
MTINQKLRVQNYCYSLVLGMFANFHNPTNRGENFTWERFSELAAGLARAQVFIIFAKKPKNLLEIEQYAYSVTESIAETSIINAGYKELI